MAFNTQGFASPIMAKYRASLRQIPEFRTWLEFSENLVGVGLQISDNQEVDVGNKHAVTMWALFIRSLKSFQACTLLAEQGLVGDARAVLRSSVEGALAQYALVIDRNFIQQLEEAEQVNRRVKARVLVSDTSTQLSVHDLNLAKATIARIDTLEAASGRKLRTINWRDVALKKDVDGSDARELYDHVYRSLSADGTHTTIQSIVRALEIGGGRVTSIKVGPDIDGLVMTLATACNVFLYALFAFDRTFGGKQEGTLRSWLARFNALPHDEPDLAKVKSVFAI